MRHVFMCHVLFYPAFFLPVFQVPLRAPLRYAAGTGKRKPSDIF